MGPQIAVYDSTDSGIMTLWDLGTIKAQVVSNVMSVYVWNNRNGATDVSDLKDCWVTVMDSGSDTANGDVAKDMWIQINVPSIDGDEDTYTRIGGALGKDVRAMAGVAGNTIAGVVNDGTLANSQPNYAKLNFRCMAPPNSNPGEKLFRILIKGYFT
jgi:hypothetical protein